MHINFLMKDYHITRLGELAVAGGLPRLACAVECSTRLFRLCLKISLLLFLIGACTGSGHPNDGRLYNNAKVIAGGLALSEVQKQYQHVQETESVWKLWQTSWQLEVFRLSVSEVSILQQLSLANETKHRLNIITSLWIDDGEVYE